MTKPAPRLDAADFTRHDTIIRERIQNLIDQHDGDAAAITKALLATVNDTKAHLANRSVDAECLGHVFLAGI